MNMTTAEFVKTINDLRKANKGKWYQWGGTVNGKAVAIKAYNTWLQIFRVNGLQVSTVSDIPVAKFTECLTNNV